MPFRIRQEIGRHFRKEFGIKKAGVLPGFLDPYP
jgi:hypothetical protein